MLIFSGRETLTYLSSLNFASWKKILLKTIETVLIVNQLGRAKSPSSNVPAKDNPETLPVLRRYYMKGCFPSDVSQIELNYDSENQVEEFDVTLQIQYWEAYDSEGAPSVV